MSDQTVLNVGVSAVHHQVVEVVSSDPDVSIGAPPASETHEISTMIVSTSDVLMPAGASSCWFDDSLGIRLEHARHPPGPNTDNPTILNGLNNLIGSAEDVLILATKTKLLSGFRCGEAGGPGVRGWPLTIKRIDGGGQGVNLVSSAHVENNALDAIPNAVEHHHVGAPSALTMTLIGIDTRIEDANALGLPCTLVYGRTERKASRARIVNLLSAQGWESLGNEFDVEIGHGCSFRYRKF